MIERAVIRNEAAVIIEDVRDEAAVPVISEGSGRKLDPDLQQRWRAFAEKLIARIAFDDPSQPLPRIGGLGWMKAALPRGDWMTLFRSTGTGRVGACVNLLVSEGLAAYERLLADRELIDEEFSDAGWSSPLPWDEQAEARQAELLTMGANQLVNSFRPRLERIGAGG